MSESGETNPSFSRLPSKSPFSPQMTWKLVHSCERKRCQEQDQRRTYSVWTHLTGDVGPSDSRRISPLYSHLFRVHDWMDGCNLILSTDNAGLWNDKMTSFSSALLTVLIFSWKHNLEQWIGWQWTYSISKSKKTVRNYLGFIKLWIRLNRLLKNW